MDVETRGFREAACATTAPMHFQLLELDLLPELLKLLLVSSFHAALVECPLLLLYYVEAILIRRGPWPWNAGACLRGACAELARGLRENTALFSEKGRQAVADVDLARCLRGAGLPNPGGAPLLNKEVKAY